jgi:hypothetical protein
MIWLKDTRVRNAPADSSPLSGAYRKVMLKPGTNRCPPGSLVQVTKKRGVFGLLTVHTWGIMGINDARQGITVVFMRDMTQISSSHQNAFAPVVLMRVIPWITADIRDGKKLLAKWRT